MVQRDSFRLAIRAMRNVCLLVGLGLLAAVFGCGRAPKEGNDHAAKLDAKSGAVVDGSKHEMDPKNGGGRYDCPVQDR